MIYDIAHCVILQKWTVNGEERIGIFAKQDLPKGTEVTIEYKYVRTYSWKYVVSRAFTPTLLPFVGTGSDRMKCRSVPSRTNPLSRPIPRLTCKSRRLRPHRRRRLGKGRWGNGKDGNE